MNKHLLALAGLLSILAVNQALGGILTIKNETENKQLFSARQIAGSNKHESIEAGETKTIITSAPVDLVYVVINRKRVGELNFPSKARLYEGSFTIKTVDGKIVIVKNQ